MYNNNLIVLKGKIQNKQLSTELNPMLVCYFNYSHF